MSDQPSFTVVFACGEGATPSVGESGNDFSEYRVIAIANGDYTERLNDAENLLAEGVHSCSHLCKRPMCVLRRELKAEREANARLREAARKVLEAGCDSTEYRAIKELQAALRANNVQDA